MFSMHDEIVAPCEVCGTPMIHVRTVLTTAYRCEGCGSVLEEEW